MAGCVNGGNSGVENGAWVVSSRIDPNEIGLARLGERWVLMPDHMHLFCSPATVPPEPLERWISYWKAEAARHWPRGAEHPLWQRDFWDTQLRHADSYNAKWSYVRLNPVRKGLVDCEAAWPFQGEENVLRWRE